MSDIYIVDVDPSDEQGSLARIRELITETGASSVAFMVTAVPNEQPLDSRLRDWGHRFNLLKDGVKDLPVQVGMLIQALIGHGDRNRIVGHLPYQTIVGADGTASRENYCPLDVDFQDYTDKLIRTLAKSRPAFFMIDDDFRIVHHPPAVKGCMCPLHLARFSQKLGKTISREELLAKFEQEHNEIRDLWEALKEDSLVELAGVIRNAIDTVDDGIPGMLCCVTSEVHFAPAIAAKLAGRHQPQIRINNAIYLESGHKSFARSVTRTFHQIAQLSKEIKILTEADTCPHSRYSLSVKSNLAHITATILAGCHGAKYWFVKTDQDGWHDTVPFMHMLAEKRPFLEEVKKVAARVAWHGPVVLGRMEEIWRKPFAQQAQLDFPSDDWGWRIFGRMGIAFTISKDGNTATSPRVMSSTAPLAYSRDELLRFLAGPILLDGEAAMYFCEKGLGEFLGVTAEHTSFPCAVEIMHGISESRYTRDAVSNMTGEGRYLLTPESAKTRIVSSYATGSQAGYTTVAPALTWFQNRHGGRVAVYGISMEAPMDWIFFSRNRKAQLVETLKWLDDGIAPAVADTDLDIFMLHGRDNMDDKLEYVSLFNLNPDTFEQVRFSLPGEKVKRIERLALHGRWQQVAFTLQEQSICCDLSAPTMEPFILRLNH